LAAISILWGTTWFVSKLTIEHIPPLQLCAVRQTIAGLFFIFYFNGIQKQPLPKGKEMLFHILLGFLFFTCSNGLTTYAIQYIPSFLGALIGCLMPFVLVLFGFLFYKERVRWQSLVALTIGFSGIGLILLNYKKDMQVGGWFAFGVLITLLSVFTWTTGSLLSTRNKWKYEAKYGIGWQMLYGGIMLFACSAAVEKSVNLWALSSTTWIYIIYLIAIGSIICFQCYLYALKHLPLSLVSIYVYINPMVALLIGMLYLSEKVTPQIVIGCGVTFLGIYLVKRFSR
jgi:drug/metabolite transporter (DMT)-like permease